APSKPIDGIVGARVTLVEYQVHSVTEGIDALGEVSVRVRPFDPSPRRSSPQLDEPRARVVHGHGADTDIVVASAKAYLAALNRVVDEVGYVTPPPPPAPVRVSRE